MSMSLLWGGGVMRRIKTPQQDFVIKRWGGGLCTRGGVFAGHYGNGQFAL